MSAGDAIELTRALVRLDTVNPPGQEERCAAVLERLLAGAGFRCRRYEFAPTRTSLVATIGGDGRRRPLGFTGHLDVVPLGAAPWSVDPFGAEIVDGRLYGRGATDMKGGLAAFIAAALELAPRLRAGPGLVLVLTAGEETACQGAVDLVHRQREAPVLGEVGALIVGEPTGNYPLVGHKGALWVRARTVGVTAHGAMPERGVNAIYKAARAIGRLEGFELSAMRHPLMGQATLNVGTVRGGLNINSVPDAAEFNVDIRTLPGQSHAGLLAALKARVGEEVALETIADVEGIVTDPADPWMQSVFRALEPVLGTPPAPRTAAYVTDASALKPAYGHPPTVILGPGEPGLAHQTDEYCTLAQLEAAHGVYRTLIEQWIEGA